MKDGIYLIRLLDSNRYMICLTISIYPCFQYSQQTYNRRELIFTQRDIKRGCFIIMITGVGWERDYGWRPMPTLNFCLRSSTIVKVGVLRFWCIDRSAGGGDLVRAPWRPPLARHQQLEANKPITSNHFRRKKDEITSYKKNINQTKKFLAGKKWITSSYKPKTQYRIINCCLINLQKIRRLIIFSLKCPFFSQNFRENVGFISIGPGSTGHPVLGRLLQRQRPTEHRPWTSKVGHLSSQWDPS